MENTFNSSNPLVRFSHQKRLSISLELTPKPSKWLLDYGGGDGTFCHEFIKNHNNQDNIVLYEPYLAFGYEDNITIARKWEEVISIVEISGSPDVICIFEVMEHFTEKLQIRTINQISNIIDRDGILIISVPIEGGVPSLVKNLFRRLRYGGGSIYNFGHIVKSLFWMPIPEARSGDKYLTHMGFYYKDLVNLLEEKFNIVRIVSSPMRFMLRGLSSQVFIVARPK